MLYKTFFNFYHHNSKTYLIDDESLFINLGLGQNIIKIYLVEYLKSYFGCNIWDDQCYMT